MPYRARVKDFALVVVSVVLAWLLGGSWGHRRQLHRVKEQLEVLALIPSAWGTLRAEMEATTDRDLIRYLASRNPGAPLHRRMSKVLDVAYSGLLIALLSQLTFVPVPERAKDAAMLIGVLMVGVAAWVNLWVLMRNRDAVRAELDTADDRQTRRKRAMRDQPPAADEV